MNSTEYWIDRYQSGGDSGQGSRGLLATHKAEVINDFIILNVVETIIDWGCGDGYLPLINIPYIGFDVSEEALIMARSRPYNKDKEYFLLQEYAGQTADLTLSLDVIFHLVEDEVYHEHMRRLFKTSNKYVIIYSSNFEARHVGSERRRKFTDWTCEYLPLRWRQIDYIKNRYPTKTYSDFYIYERGE
jgi:hypothetical protein